MGKKIRNAVPLKPKTITPKWVMNKIREIRIAATQRGK